MNLPKSQGGLGVKNLEKMNMCLLGKWIFKAASGSGIWNQIVEAKYLRGKSCFQVKNKNTESPCWTDILALRPLVHEGCRWEVGSGTKVRFWEDSWIDGKPLALTYANLYDIVEQHEVSVREVVEGLVPLSFCRILTDEQVQKLYGLIKKNK
uniref:Reverse transcriptase zinc-binding domain-containing protein n=1 Tax=Arundo donax TaxID=35708 RepID=A0A0A9HQM5_ARUDO